MKKIINLIRTERFYVISLSVVSVAFVVSLFVINRMRAEITVLKKYRAWLEDVAPKSYIKKYYKKDLEDYIRNNYISEGDSIRFNTQWRPVLNNRIDNYYCDGNDIYWSNAEYTNPSNDPFIYEADAETFMIAVGTGYAKDKNHVYYPRYPLRNSDVIYQYMPRLSRCPVDIVYNANPETFQCLGWGFATDGDHMYFEGREIQWEKAFYDPAVCKRMYEMHRKFEGDYSTPVNP